MNEAAPNQRRLVARVAEPRWTWRSGPRHVGRVPRRRRGGPIAHRRRRMLEEMDPTAFRGTVADGVRAIQAYWDDPSRGKCVARRRYWTTEQWSEV